MGKLDSETSEDLKQRFSKVLDELDVLVKRLGVDMIKIAHLRTEAEELKQELLSREKAER